MYNKIIDGIEYEYMFVEFIQYNYENLQNWIIKFEVRLDGAPQWVHEEHGEGIFNSECFNDVYSYIR